MHNLQSNFLKLIAKLSMNLLLLASYTTINALEDTKPTAAPALVIARLRITIPTATDTFSDTDRSDIVRAPRARANSGKRQACLSPKTHCFERTCISCFKTKRELHTGSSIDCTICAAGPGICDCSIPRSGLSREAKK